MTQLDKALNAQQKTQIRHLLDHLIDQHAARVIVPPQAQQPGFWFGSGNLVQDANGTIWMCGRYRNQGDSRTGLQAGERGVAWVVFRSDDQGYRFQKVLSLTKDDLSFSGRRVISIEGSALHLLSDGTWEAFISSEKDIPYPTGLDDFQKSGTGVWTIDRITGPSPEQFDPSTVTPVLENGSSPSYLHLKDPDVFDLQDGRTAMIFCSHPFTWASSNSGLAVRPAGETDFQVASYQIVSRGASWDVAATRITNRMPLPPVGFLQDVPPQYVYFYDGAECMRPLDENRSAKRRPRGYSCEEISGAFLGSGESWTELERLSELQPFFVSPYGTGCSRYVRTLSTSEGILAVWQQGQENGSQPLVSHFLPMSRVEELLSKEHA